jgi:hypothetical protein
MIKTVYDWIFNRKLRRKITVQEAVEKLYSRIPHQEFATIPVDLYEDIKKYIREKKIKGTHKIFQISRQALWGYLKRKGIEPHDLRRYAAYRSTKAGKSLKEIQGMLRHRSVETTDSFLKSLSIHEK